MLLVDATALAVGVVGVVNGLCYLLFSPFVCIAVLCVTWSGLCAWFFPPLLFAV